MLENVVVIVEIENNITTTLRYWKIWLTLKQHYNDIKVLENLVDIVEMESTLSKTKRVAI